MKTVANKTGEGAKAVAAPIKEIASDAGKAIEANPSLNNASKQTSTYVKSAWGSMMTAFGA